MSTAVQKVLANALLELPGGRHDAATRATMRLALLERSGHPGAPEARAALGDVFLQMVSGDRSSRREAKREFEAMLTSAAAKVDEEGWALTSTEEPPVLPAGAMPGLLGDVIATILPETEADEAALVADMLVSFGSAVGDGPHAFAGGSEHPGRLNIVLVGPSSRGRKGTARAEIKRLFDLADPDWSANTLSGLSTGEGLINALHGEIERSRRELDLRENDGVGHGWGHADPDLRRLVVEPEFARVLGTFRREGNTLSAIIRELYDSGTVRVLTRGNPLEVDGAHVSIIGHVTQEELRKKLSDTDIANGFANRFLYVATARSKLLPSGGRVPDEKVDRLAEAVGERLAKARQAGRLERSPKAEAFWREIYEAMADNDRGGVLGAVTARAEAQVLRLSVIYALMSDDPTEISVDDVQAAWAMWRYCEQSAAYIWKSSSGGSDSDRILQAIRASGDSGLDMTAVADIFSRNRSKAKLEDAIEPLIESGQVVRRRVATGGRPRETLVLHEQAGHLS